MDKVTISHSGRRLHTAERQAPLQAQLLALREKNSALQATHAEQQASAHRAACAINGQAEALLAAYNRERQLAEYLADIINAAHNHNHGSVIGLASAALRVIA